MKTIDLEKAADRVLSNLATMSDEELLNALGACEDNSISYAICHDWKIFLRQYVVKSFYINSGYSVSFSAVDPVDMDHGEFIHFDEMAKAANDSYYVLAA